MYLLLCFPSDSATGAPMPYFQLTLIKPHVMLIRDNSIILKTCCHIERRRGKQGDEKY
jgi:hypothetical protein